MVERKNLDQIGEDLKLSPEKEKTGPGRKPGSKGEFESPKGKPEKWKEKEIWKHRKEIKQLREEKDKLKDQIPKAADNILPPDMLGAIPAMIYDYMAMRYGQHWRLSEPEVKQYGDALAQVLNRYLPEETTKHGELIYLGSVIIISTVPRVYVTLKQAHEVENGAGKTESGDQRKPDRHGGDNHPGSKRKRKEFVAEKEAP